MNKEELRKSLIEKRKEIINKKELSTRIVDNLINLDIYRKAKVIALYKSMNNEVDTNSLINEALKDKIVILPKIVDNKMIFIMINNDTMYSKSSFGVLEPIGDIYLENIDLIIVPGIAFDKNLNRLGYGKGYYDQYLCNKDIYKIGICFSSQMVNIVPTNDYDIKMDMVITDKKIYRE